MRYVTGFARGGWGTATQHAVDQQTAEQEYARWGTRGVTVKAICGVWVGVNAQSYGTSYYDKCKRCEAKIAKTAVAS